MRHHRERRGVSEIVGILLMLAMVVSLGVLISAFADGAMASLSGGFASAMTGQQNAALETFRIEQVAFSFSGTTGADVYVRNVGGVQTNLVSVYITDTTSNTLVLQTTIATTLGVGTVVEIPHTTLTFTPSHGHAYSFTVTSSLGNSATYGAEAT